MTCPLRFGSRSHQANKGVLSSMINKAFATVLALPLFGPLSSCGSADSGSSSAAIEKEYEYYFNDTKVNTDEFNLIEASLVDDFYFTHSIADPLFYQYTLTDSDGVLVQERGGGSITLFRLRKELSISFLLIILQAILST